MHRRAVKTRNYRVPSVSGAKDEKPHGVRACTTGPALAMQEDTVTGIQISGLFPFSGCSLENLIYFASNGANVVPGEEGKGELIEG